MEFRQLEMFIAVVEEGNFQKAAERMFRTQPSVSIALRKLEEEISTPLFDRSNRQAYCLTERGERFYESARRLLRLRDDMILQLREPSGLSARHLRIGTDESISLYALPNLIRMFHDAHPDVRVEIVHQPSEGVSQRLQEGEIDVAIVSTRSEEPGLEFIPVLRDELVVIVNPQHRLARRRQTHIRELAGESVVAYEMRSEWWQEILNGFRQTQTPLNIVIRAATIEMIKKLVSGNLGIGFIPRICASEEVARGELALISVDEFDHERMLWLGYRRADPLAAVGPLFAQILCSTAR